MAKLAPDFSSSQAIRQARMMEDKYEMRQGEQDANAKNREKWDYISNVATNIKEKAQSAVQQTISSNFLKNSIPQGKFVAQGDEISWVWNKDATIKRLPDMDKGWEDYKRSMTLTGQIPNYGNYYALYNQMKASYANAMDSKFKKLESLGFTPEDVGGALLDDDLLYNLSQTAGTTTVGPKGEAISVGTAISPYLKEVVGKKDKGFWDIRDELWSPFGMDTFKGGGLAYGAVKGIQKAPEVTTKVKGKVSQKLAERQIKKSGLAKTRTPQKITGDLVKYLQNNSSDDLVKLLAKKGFAKKAAAKLATRITAISAAATLGTAAAPVTGGASAALGYGMTAWGLYDIWNVLQEIAPFIEEKVYGDVPSTEF